MSLGGEEPEVDRLDRALAAVAAARAKSTADRDRIRKAGGKTALARLSKQRKARRERKLSRLSLAELAKYRHLRARQNANSRRWHALHRATAEDFAIVAKIAPKERQ